MEKHILTTASLRHGLFQFHDQQAFDRRKKDLLFKAGETLEKTVSTAMENGLEAPELNEEPKPFQWYRIPLADGICADGNEYHIYLRKGSSRRLCIFLSGGGLAWNEYTASHPITAGAQAAWEPNYYYSNLRPVTELMNIGSGIMENNSGRNPFYDWNFVVITYATGDFHIGQNTWTYLDESGKKQIVYFHGYANFQASMRAASRYFQNMQQLLLAGDSAGGFAIPCLAEEIADHWYPSCSDISILSDSSMLIYDSWLHTVRDLWKAGKDKYDCIKSDNIVLDWYTRLIRRNPGRFRCLYCGSTHDYILSTYYNDVTNKTYGTDQEVQNAFYEQLNHMVAGFRILDPSFGIFIHNMKNPLTRGGTVHTSVRKPWFYAKFNGQSICGWLRDAVIEHNSASFGLELL